MLASAIIALLMVFTRMRLVLCLSGARLNILNLHVRVRVFDTKLR